MHDDVVHVQRRAQLDEGAEVLEARMHAAVGHQAEQVHALGAGQRLSQHLVPRQRAVGHGVIDSREVLTHHGPRPEVEVPHLGVAHLAVGQADGAAAGGQLRMRVALPQLVEHRGVGQRDRVARPGRREPPTVQDDQARPPYGEAVRAGRRRHQRGAASTIAANDPASRLAPPTSAPSTSGLAISPPALSGVTDPP